MKIKRLMVLFTTLLLCSFVSINTATAKVVVNKQGKDFVTLRNEHISLKFNLAKGTYQAESIKDKAFNFIDAKYKVNKFISSDPGLTHTWESVVVDDELGKGTSLVITSKGNGSPELKLVITLYEGNDFLVFSSGINNTLTQAFTVNDMEPLYKATFFDGVTNKTKFKILNGPGGAGNDNSGGNRTRVHDVNYLESPNNVFATFLDNGKRKSVLLGGITYNEYSKYAQAEKKGDEIIASVICWDSIGKYVDPNTSYMPNDKCYVDFTTVNQFEALENYGLRFQKAQNVNLMIHDFPTVDGWYVAIFSGGGSEPNNSAGMVAMMDAANKSGFLNYSKLAVRLIPDTYGYYTEQGWWDDEHWRKFGHLVEPYETTKKWADAVIKRGGIPLIYNQTSNTSRDFITAHPDWYLFNDTTLLFTPDGKEWSWKSIVDFTDKGFDKHLDGVYENLKEGNVLGLMFDYPESSFRNDVGCFDDKYATGASVYRSIYAKPKKILGPGSYIDERNIWSQPSGRGAYMDITAGVVDNQRVWGDTDIASPEMYSLCGHRWYKNRVIFTYDMDSKNLHKLGPQNRDGLNQVLTMAYVVAPRLVLANSFSTLNEEEVHALSRIYPIHTTPKSSRPIDAFEREDGIPRIYDFDVNPSWHQITFYNPDTTNNAKVSVNMSKETTYGGLGLNPESSYYVYDFWNDNFIGKVSGNSEFSQDLRRGEVRMMSVHEIEANPQFISTNRHVMQGYVDMVECKWDEAANALKGISKVVAGETYKVTIATNGKKAVCCNSNNSLSYIDRSKEKDGIITLCLNTNTNNDVNWNVKFE